MKAKFYLTAALLGGVVIFVWSTIAHMALPWWNDILREMPNEQAVVDAVRGSGIGNGMWYGMQGMFLVTFFGKGMTDGVPMWPYMLTEFATNVFLALLLAWLLVRLHERSIPRIGIYAGVIGLAGWVANNVSYWVWYNFAFGYILLEAADTVVAAFLAGLVIGWLMQRERVKVGIEPTRARAAA